MNVLIACEESQEVCKAFRAKGHNAFSCDISYCSGGHPEWHIKRDVLPLLDGRCEFNTCDGATHKVEGKWDLIIAHPPCTHLAVSGARHFERKRANGSQAKAIEFFCKFLEADCDRIVIENPVNIIGGEYVRQWFPELAARYGLPIKPTQYIQPYEFGEPTRKKTGLWIKGLPKLVPTNIVEPKLITYTNKDGKKRTDTIWHRETGCGCGKVRSKTFPGIAKAFAEQWG